MSTEQHYIDERFMQLHKLIVEYGKLAWQFLMAVNGGGAIAILTLLGAVTELRKDAWMYLSLGGYIFGVSLVGIALAQQVIKFQHLQIQWKKNSLDYYQGNITWQKLISDDDERVKNQSYFPWLFGISSLATFLLITIFSAYKLASSPLGS